MAELGYKGCYYFNNISNCNFKIDDTNFSNGDFCLEWWQLPNYKEWGAEGHKVRVDGRVWIKVK